MSYIIYGTARSRITLYEVDGTTPKYRVTLQRETKEGLSLVFKPEGAAHQLGSGANWAKSWTHRNFRASLDLRWNYGKNSLLETWTSGAWSAPVITLTPTVLSLIFTWAFQSPCLVEPHMDKAYTFSAQPDPGKALALNDTKGVAHKDLALSLIATEVAPLPDWASL
ncbi:hypothetical protein [Geothrix fuzhouensis]|uniref:hypothetical protein n=1 Tax=Geothrix fuzhouensis TaxID=2966451 RepID=UPI00214804B4|nr:hypothetical protein [Geothrix fuzhouensis]